jgi:hypothetical protein
LSQIYGGVIPSGCRGAGQGVADDSHAPATRLIVRRAAFSFASSNTRRFWKVVFIVQGKLGGLEEPVKVIKETRVEAWEAVSDLLDRGTVNITIDADGRIYTTREFALTLLDSRD